MSDEKLVSAEKARAVIELHEAAIAGTKDITVAVTTLAAQAPALARTVIALHAERDEARAELARLRTCEGYLADRDRDAAWTAGAEAMREAILDALPCVTAEREACAVLCDAIGDAAETERDACCDDRSRSLHAGRMHGADECARAIRARGATDGAP